MPLVFHNRFQFGLFNTAWSCAVILLNSSVALDMFLKIPYSGFFLIIFDSAWFDAIFEVQFVDFFVRIIDLTYNTNNAFLLSLYLIVTSDAIVKYPREITAQVRKHGAQSNGPFWIDFRFFFFQFLGISKKYNSIVLTI